ncbi:Autophagy-related protein 18h [Linum grandiflorum]
MQPLPAKAEGCEGFRAAHPLVLVVACDESKSPALVINGKDGLVKDGINEHQSGAFALNPTIVRFYSLKSHNYVHVLRFRSPVFMVRCSPQIVAVGLATQIYCFDALTLENKFSVLTYPVPQLVSQGGIGANTGYGPMAVGPRWLAYASDNPLVSNTGRLSPQSLTPTLGVSPSTSPGNGNLVARYAMESSKQLATGLMSLGDMGYKTLSRYCQDFITDGSGSPVSPNSGWKVGRAATHSPEADTAGMVVVKDFVSRAVISQFRAHTSPISALCFDPSGTLLVTASIHGNNINIFRIMPSSVHGGSGAKSYNWSSAHVHLYKLHRGITSAVIQDICFSSYSQWVAIISSRGTCHIFALSPFGGENVLQIQNSNVDGPILLPVLSLPWWSTPSFQVNQHIFSASPPAPVTLSVVARIKDNHSGWLNTVSNAASSAAGKASLPSGALAAVFHNCVPRDLQPSHLKKVNAMEHLVSYTPSGHVVQYKLVSSVGAEPSEGTPRVGLASSLQTSDEELHVKTESVQWWDVCRRADWPEREENISGLAHSSQENADMAMDTSECEDNGTGIVRESDYGETVTRNMDLVKSHEQSHLYLANAEVQMSPWRTPLWQKSKVYFYAMTAIEADKQYVAEDHYSGEIEIEKVPVHEVEIRRKDLLPVFDHFHRAVGWNDRELRRERSTLSTGSYGVNQSAFPAALQQPKTVSSSSGANSDGGSSTNLYISSAQHVHGKFGGRGGISGLASPLLYQSPTNNNSGFKPTPMSISPAEDDSNSMNSDVASLTHDSPSPGRNMGNERLSSNGVLTSESSHASSNRSDLSANIIDEGMVNESPDFEQLFQEGYCKVGTLSEKLVSREPEDPDEEDDDMLGGVFAFSEEG